MNDDIHILVVDDDRKLRSLIAKYLMKQGFIVTVACDAADARTKMAYFIFDLIVLDVMMPDESGVEFAAKLTANDDKNTPPILMLTAMGEQEDVIVGLEAGADDYLSKPFEPRELELRVHSILRRTKRRQKQENTLIFGDYSFNVADGTLMHHQESIYLTESEAGLLKTLAEHVGKPISRELLVEASAGTISSERSVDVQINRLRKKIELDPAKPIYIQTLRGAGYVLKTGG